MNGTILLYLGKENRISFFVVPPVYRFFPIPVIALYLLVIWGKIEKVRRRSTVRTYKVFVWYAF